MSGARRSSGRVLVLWHLLLTAGWVLLLGVSATAMVSGVVASYFVFAVIGVCLRRRAIDRYCSRLEAGLVLAGVFIIELVRSTWRVGVLVFRPARSRPGFIAYPLRVHSDGEITLLANLITLTPGTLSVRVAADRRSLVIHALEAESPNAVCQAIHDAFESRIMALSAL